jgi:predicted dehydrogenase
VELSEKLETNAGWSYPYVAEEVLQGYQGELTDFVRSAAAGSRAKSDGKLGRDVLEIIYASYVSSEEGAPVVLQAGKEPCDY